MKERKTLCAFDVLAVLMGLLVILGRALPVRAADRVFIFSVTADRLFFSALTLALLIRRFLRKKAEFPLSRGFLLFAGMMIFWILWGAAAAFISPYCSLWEGGQACFALLRGLMILYCMYEVLDTRRRTDLFVSALRAVCVMILLLALWEAISGWHIWASIYGSMPVVVQDGRRWMTGLYQDNLFLATGICYNENNFCTILTILLPLFFLTRGQRPWKSVLYALVLALGVFVLLLDDANINAVALFLALAAYLLAARGNWLKKAGMLGGFVLLYAKAANWIGHAVLKLKGLLFRGARASDLLANAGLSFPPRVFSRIPTGDSLIDSIRTMTHKAAVHSDGALTANGLAMRSGLPRIIGAGGSLTDNLQTGIANALANQRGPLMIRILIYRDVWDGFLASRGLGLGPGGFSIFNPMNSARQTNFRNPHNWWLEVLCEYGVVVFLLYLAGILTLYIKMILAYRRNRDELFALVIAMCTGFVMACIAPSSYVGEVYQWILPGLCLVLLRQDRERDSSET